MASNVWTLLLVIGLSLLPCQSQGQPTRVQVEALSSNSAVLNIDGQRKMLRAGQSFAGVTLVAADAKFATLRINGEEKKVGLSQHIGTSYAQPKEMKVTIARDDRNQYLTTALINGRSSLVLIDTGANIVAMSAWHAQALGIDYFGGELSQVETASGRASAYRLTLRSVSVGGIEVENVLATVVEGNYPVTTLLGMSYLKHVKLQEHNGVLTLSRTH